MAVIKVLSFQEELIFLENFISGTQNILFLFPASRVREVSHVQDRLFPKTPCQQNPVKKCTSM